MTWSWDTVASAGPYANNLHLADRKGIQPVKKLEWWGTGVVICLERDADLHLARLMPVPLTVSCFSKIQIDFTFLVPAHPGSPRKRAVKQVCVCVSSQDKLGGLQQKGHLVGSTESPDGVAFRHTVISASASVIFPCTIKSRRWQAIMEEVDKGCSEFCITVGTVTY